MNRIYLIGSLRNPNVPLVAQVLRQAGYEVFDDWHAPGPTVDERWQEYEQARGRTFIEALAGWHARHVFLFDKSHLDRAEVGVMVLPAGRSGHLEFGYLVGQGKPGYILLDGEPDRYDVMYGFATAIVPTLEGLQQQLQQGKP